MERSQLSQDRRGRLCRPRPPTRPASPARREGLFVITRTPPVARQVPSVLYTTPVYPTRVHSDRHRITTTPVFPDRVDNASRRGIGYEEKVSRQHSAVSRQQEDGGS